MSRRTSVVVLAALLVAAAVSTALVAAQEDGTKIEYDGDAITVASDTNQTIHGQSDLEPGTTLAVRVQSQGDNPLLMSSEATVEDDGSFEAAFDFSNAPAGTEFEVAVLHDGTKLESARGMVAGELPTTTVGSETPASADDGGGWLPVNGYLALAVGAVLALLGVGLLIGVYDT